MAERTRSSYVLLGGIGGLVVGISAVLQPGFSEIALFALPIAIAAGAFLGVTLHATKKWNEHGPAGDLLRWISGLGGAGLAVGTIGLLFGALSVALALGCAGGGLVAGVGFGLQSQQRTVFGDDGYRERTSREIVQLWCVLLGSLAIGVGLIALGIYLGE